MKKRPSDRTKFAREGIYVPRAVAILDEDFDQPNNTPIITQYRALIGSKAICDDVWEDHGEMPFIGTKPYRN